MSGDAKLILPNKSLLAGATKADFDELSANHNALSSDYSEFKQNTISDISDLQDNIDAVAAKSLKVNLTNSDDPWNNVNPVTHKKMWDWGDVYFVLLNGILLSRVSYTEGGSLELTAVYESGFKMLTINIPNKSANWKDRYFSSTNWSSESLTVNSVLIFTVST
jgi:hypothetical protein